MHGSGHLRPIWAVSISTASAALLMALAAPGSRLAQSAAPASQSGAKSPAPAAAASAPKAQVVNPVYDFGTVLEGQRVVHSFAIRNVGTKDLILNGVKTSCGCTVAAPSLNRVPPGGESQVAVTFDTHFQKGHRERTITVYTNDPANPNAEMTLQGEV